MVDRPLSSILARHCRQLSKDLKLDGGNGNKPGSKKPGSKKGKNKNKGESGEGSKTKGQEGQEGESLYLGSFRYPAI